MKIRYKYALGVIVIILLLSAGMLFVVSGLKQMSEGIQYVAKYHVTELEATTEMSLAYSSIEVLVNKFIMAIITDDPNKGAGEQEKIAQNIQRFENALNSLESIILTQIEAAGGEEEEEEAAKLHLLRKMFETYKQNLTEIATVSRETDADKANLLVRGKNIGDEDVKLLEYIRWFKQDAKDEMNEKFEAAYSQISASEQTSIITVTVVLLVSVILGWFITRLITAPIYQLTESVVRIGRGDLNFKINIKSNDEIGLLASCFQQMVDSVKTHLDDLDREVAERRQAENTLRRVNRRIEAANEDMRNFVYIASHDLREPLRKVMSFGRLLQSSLMKNISENDAENLSFMIDGAERMTKMVEGLLVYSRIVTKKSTLEPVDINQILEQLEKIELSVKIEETHAVIEVIGALPSIQSDSAYVRQLMQNLIANGIKYQPKGNIPHITISSETLPEGMVKFMVTDNGIGIKPEYHKEIFKMFRRLHSKAEYEGIGIGLSTCKKIVENSGGEMGVESEYGRGSTFWFTMPLALEAVPETVCV